VFSAMDASVAMDIEREFAENGYAVLSNAKCYRMEPYVPLLIPEVNADHLRAIKLQREVFGNGFIVTNPNCSTIGLCVALAPLHQKFGVSDVVVSTMQALSGAGFPGVASLDIIDNILPHIGGEEEKMLTETRKLLGTFDGRKFGFSDIRVSAHCNRVQVKDGHLETVSVKLKKKPSQRELTKAFKDFNPLKGLGLPLAPDPPIVVRDEDDRPQPRVDRDIGKGMAVSVGRIRGCDVLDYRFIVLSHNTIRGAAGASVLNAELLKAKGYMKNL
jgi:aspartate-semialdehyde dehydrogenase